jgi:hypothetical protein
MWSLGKMQHDTKDLFGRAPTPLKMALAHFHINVVLFRGLGNRGG